ncbi:Gfo/Idh/MocA family protein [Salinimicrobium oceani]|uniref:Gfo/Idh/MocA family oxidoreductase n=1 Tax=Salinimicrobium oceani TaxID=2722702 RepID=A0ABX1CW97_9FLAO|nr:Gfo/Idh/MocA family oxidoreductase [Salinimicrobium oceani]NJW52570.1 Gfo/Idh/MocA family oxidoreductase [Salinimicrobium oceani]
MNKKSINWGILGAGKIAGKFAISLKQVENACLYAVASRSQEKATAFAEKFEVQKAFGSYESMLQNKEIDIVYVATPHVFHYAHSMLSLDFGKAVLCEKPFAMNRKQVEEMIATAKTKNLLLMEAMWTPFLPHIQYLKELLESQKYGKIKKLTADFGFDAPFDEQGRLFKKSLGGGSLLDIGIYPVFLALHTLGIPEKIEAKATLGKTEVDEDCEIRFLYRENVKADLKSSIIKRTPTVAVFELEHAVIEIASRWHEPSTITIISSGETEMKNFEVASYGYEFEARHVQEMLFQGRTESNVMTFQKSLELISLLDKVRELIKLEY